VPARQALRPQKDRVGVFHIGWIGRDLRVPLAQQLGVHEQPAIGPAQPDEPQEPAIPIRLRDIPFQHHPPPIHQPLVCRRCLRPHPLDTEIDLRRVDADVAHVVQPPIDGHLDGVAVDHPGHPSPLGRPGRPALDHRRSITGPMRRPRRRLSAPSRSWRLDLGEPRGGPCSPDKALRGGRRTARGNDAVRQDRGGAKHQRERHAQAHRGLAHPSRQPAQRG
jgi:hypothetical protein